MPAIEIENKKKKSTSKLVIITFSFFFATVSSKETSIFQQIFLPFSKVDLLNLVVKRFIKSPDLDMSEYGFRSPNVERVFLY